MRNIPLRNIPLGGLVRELENNFPSVRIRFLIYQL